MINFADKESTFHLILLNIIRIPKLLILQKHEMTIFLKDKLQENTKEK